MDRALFIAASATDHLMTAQRIQANNLANVNTIGFRADFAEAQANATDDNTLSSRVMVTTKPGQASFKQGAIEKTNRDLDVAINGDGWFAVQGQNGQEAYTRAGDFHLSPEGLLMTSNDELVLGNGGPIAIPPAESLEIGRDGTISIRPAGQEANSLAQVDRLKLVKPPLEELHKGKDGLFYSEQEAPAQPDASVNLTAGAVESSNVDVIETLINIIDISRQYEMDTKLMDTVKKDADQTTNILELN